MTGIGRLSSSRKEVCNLDPKRTGMERQGRTDKQKGAKECLAVSLHATGDTAAEAIARTSKTLCLQIRKGREEPAGIRRSREHPRPQRDTPPVAFAPIMVLVLFVTSPICSACAV